MLSTEAQELLARAALLATQKRQQLSVEHLLIALLDARSLTEFWRTFGAETEKLKALLNAYCDKHGEHVNDDFDVLPTLGFQRTLQRAVFHIQTARPRSESRLQPNDIVAALLSEEGSYACELLRPLKLTRQEVLEYFEPDPIWG